MYRIVLENSDRQPALRVARPEKITYTVEYDIYILIDLLWLNITYRSKEHRKHYEETLEILIPNSSNTKMQFVQAITCIYI